MEAVGHGTLGVLWAFDVTQVVRGDVPDRMVADVAAEPEPDGSGMIVGSCALPVRLSAGATYEVGGNMGEAADGESRMFVGLCGGSLRQIQAAPPAGEVVPIEGTQETNDSTTGWGWLAVGVLAVSGVCGSAFAFRARRRRATAQPAV